MYHEERERETTLVNEKKHVKDGMSLAWRSSNVCMHWTDSVQLELQIVMPLRFVAMETQLWPL